MATQAERDAQSVANRELARLRRQANARRQLALGDEVQILHHAGAGGYGIVMETGIRVARLDGTGEGIYTAVDLRWIRSGN